MKKVLLIILAVSHGQFAFAQKEYTTDWVEGKIFFHDSATISQIAINNYFFEGTLLVRSNNEVKSFSPELVAAFEIKAEESKDSILFISVPTKFLKRPGRKKSFLKSIYLDKYFSLFAKHIPDKKRAPFILPLANGWASIGVYSYLEDEEVLFLEFQGKAYQFTKPKSSDYRNHFTVDKKIFFQILGERKEPVKNYMKSRKKKLSSREDIIDIIKFANTTQLPIE